MKMFSFFFTPLHNSLKPLGATLSDLIYFSSITQRIMIFFHLLVFLASCREGAESPPLSCFNPLTSLEGTMIFLFLIH